MFIKDGGKFDISLQYIGADGTQYPAGWFLDVINRDIAAITEVPDPVTVEII